MMFVRPYFVLLLLLLYMIYRPTSCCETQHELHQSLQRSLRILCAAETNGLRWCF